jgi:hypothetical protein
MLLLDLLVIYVTLAVVTLLLLVALTIIERCGFVWIDNFIVGDHSYACPTNGFH